MPKCSKTKQIVALQTEFLFSCKHNEFAFWNTQLVRVKSLLSTFLFLSLFLGSVWAGIKKKNNLAMKNYTLDSCFMKILFKLRWAIEKCLCHVYNYEPWKYQLYSSYILTSVLQNIYLAYSYGQSVNKIVAVE